jgi:filamentous hemagglutinin
MFSPEGQGIYTDLVGREIRDVDDLANALRNGEVSPSQIPVDFVDLDGTRLILNTRTSTALSRADIPREDWYGVNRTGQVADEETGALFDDLARAQLQRNERHAVDGQIGWPSLQ